MKKMEAAWSPANRLEGSNLSLSFLRTVTINSLKKSFSPLWRNLFYVFSSHSFLSNTPFVWQCLSMFLIGCSCVAAPEQSHVRAFLMVEIVNLLFQQS